MSQMRSPESVNYAVVIKVPARPSTAAIACSRLVITALRSVPESRYWMDASILGSMAASPNWFCAMKAYASAQVIWSIPLGCSLV